MGFRICDLQQMSNVNPGGEHCVDWMGFPKNSPLQTRKKLAHKKRGPKASFSPNQTNTLTKNYLFIKYCL